MNLKEFFLKNDFIHTINLNGNFIGDGIQHICEGMKKNKNIQNLNIGLNVIDDYNIKDVCEMIIENNHLKILSLISKLKSIQIIS